MQSLVSIVIFRAVLGVTDTNLSNVLVDEDLRLFSVDEKGIGNYSADELLEKKPMVYMLNLIKSIVTRTRFKALLPSWFSDEEERKGVEDDVRVMFKPYHFESKTVCWECVQNNLSAVTFWLGARRRVVYNRGQHPIGLQLPANIWSVVYSRGGAPSPPLPLSQSIDVRIIFKFGNPRLERLKAGGERCLRLHNHVTPR